MQFKITFRVLQPGQLLPLSYQYELSAWIYKLISRSDSEFGQFLHQYGYASETKRFKLFTFSNLHVQPPFDILDDRMKINSREVSFVVSFLVGKAAREMIMGLFQEQRLRLGDRVSQVDLLVEQVEALPLPHWKGDTVHLKALSPITVNCPEKGADGKLRHNYLHPADEHYTHYFFKNLLDKHEAAVRHSLAEPVHREAPLRFRLLSEKPKMRDVRIRAFTPAETKVIGYLYDFELQAPRELVRVGLLAGFGGENALGFGATRVVRSSRTR
jgi:CRISPR-associated endoribonuclease Cas6